MRGELHVVTMTGMTTAKPLTTGEVARETGLSETALQLAVRRGVLSPDAGRLGRYAVFTDEQLDELRTAAKFVALGVGVLLAIKLVKAGAVPPGGLAA